MLLGPAVFRLGLKRSITSPGVYKDIHAVMAAQTDLVEVLGQFDPKLVKMCPAGDRAED